MSFQPQIRLNFSSVFYGVLSEMKNLRKQPVAQRMLFFMLCSDSFITHLIRSCHTVRVLIKTHREVNRLLRWGTAAHGQI